MAVQEHVGLVRHAHAAQAALFGVGECRLEDALHPPAGVDLHLLSQLVGRPFLEDPAGPRVEPFGVLAEDDELELFASLPLSGLSRSSIRMHGRRLM